MTQRLFVLDTNVLMHDPSSLFRFDEHDLFIPMVVLEELDNGKKGLSETARNVRQVSRTLDELLSGRSQKDIEAGIPLTDLEGISQSTTCTGRLFLQTREMSGPLPPMLPGNKPDHSILQVTLGLQAELRNKRQVVLVSKDINLRLKAKVIGIVAEDYNNDQVLDDLDLLYSGWREVPTAFWSELGSDLTSWTDNTGRTFYKASTPAVRDWCLNEFIAITDGPEDAGIELMVRQKSDNEVTLELIRNYREGHQSAWGIHARNREQNFALNLLMDPEIEFVTLLGAAGTGKTLLALAAGLSQVLDHPTYREIVVTRVTIPVGEDIGFLPGTEEEKMTPWMGALMDNLEVLTQSLEGGNWERAATNDLLAKRIKIRSLNFMRGRTFLYRWLIIDEAQNLTSKQMRTLITRAGPGTKVLCMGNLNQIDTPYLTETTSGLTYVVDRMRGWAHGGHITLARGERSRLADYASQNL
ncbi:MAG: PhoH family protein [Oceanococcaceae bacterium]